MDSFYFDLPTLLIYLFWIFFALLVIYIRREDKRVGYPLESDRPTVAVQGYPAIPAPRTPRAKHPALEGTDTPMHQQPTPADGMKSAAPGDAAVAAMYAVDEAINGNGKSAAAPPAAPAPQAAPPVAHQAPAAPAEPAGPETHHEPSDEEPDR